MTITRKPHPGGHHDESSGTTVSFPRAQRRVMTLIRLNDEQLRQRREAMDKAKNDDERQWAGIRCLPPTGEE